MPRFKLYITLQECECKLQAKTNAQHIHVNKSRSLCIKSCTILLSGLEITLFFKWL